MLPESIPDAQLVDSLRLHFGFPDFRTGQVEAIQNLLDGRHTLVVMPTGAGKSLIYQLGALHRPGLTLVISPLIALMKDQVDSLNRHKIPATFINSAIPAHEQSRRLKGLSLGQYRIVYVAPERLRSVSFGEALDHQKVSLLAVDEAHCISEWGHDFRPDYLYIAAWRAKLGNPLTIALTATATPQVQDDILRLLGLPAACKMVTGFNRPNLTFGVRYFTLLPRKLEALRELIANHKEGATIVYTGTRNDAEQVAEFLRRVLRVAAQHYHAGLESEARANIQEDFMSGNLRVVAATNAFGLGIDRADVRQVIHYSLPGSLEAYYQEAGRAGRDGLPANATLLYAPQDRALQEWFIENSFTSVNELRALYEALDVPDGEEIWVTAEKLSRLSGLPEVKVRVGLDQLERSGALKRLGSAGVRMLLRRGAWDGEAIQAVSNKAREHKHHKETQLGRMIAYAEANTCRRQILLAHFGDRGPADAPQCCDNCQSNQTCSSPSSDVSRLTEHQKVALIILDCVHRLKTRVGREKLAHILKGSSASDIRKFHYDQNPYYGRLAVFSQKEIKGLIEQLIQQGYFKVVGGEYPVICLTPRGESGLRAKAAVPLQLPRPISAEAAERQKAEREAGGRVDGFHRQMRSSSDLSTAEQIQRIVHLGDSKASAAVPELINSLEDSNGNVRRLAASALGKIKDPRSVEPLLKLLGKEKKPQVRQYAVKALGSIGDPRAQHLLEKIARDECEREYTRKAAIIAIGRLRTTSKKEASQ
ncbi:MAG TPA: RecQ family ATP-dependent DNA helicase [Anaerolineales bacterium]